LKDKKQDTFPWIKDKSLRNVINHKEGFYLVTCKDYDRDIDIIHSNDPKFEVSLKRSLEPGLIDVFDSKIITEDKISGSEISKEGAK
jgi:hypothetical protein